MSNDVRNAFGPNRDENSPINVIAQAFEMRDKNLNHIVQNISEAIKVRDRFITELADQITDLKRQVKELQDQKIDSIILKE